MDAGEAESIMRGLKPGRRDSRKCSGQNIWMFAIHHLRGNSEPPSMWTELNSMESRHDKNNSEAVANLSIHSRGIWNELRPMEGS